MPLQNQKSFVIALAMLIAASLSVFLTPDKRLADQGPKVDLEALIPQQFGDWKLDNSIIPIQVSPDVQAALDAIYNQTLSRTYMNDQGQRIMLSIAYGSDQGGDSMQVHRPEYCYKAQGFDLDVQGDETLNTKYGAITVRRLLGEQRARVEPITYWITIGDKTLLPGLQRKLTQMAYGLTGEIPDGLLFRVSSIDRNPEKAYQIQDQFVAQLLDAVPTSTRIKLIGKQNHE
ncbi:MAG: exosortase-associated protein EpsI, B-type [Pseudomonadota bacterium]